MIFTKVLRFQPNRPLHGLGLLLGFTIEVIEGVIQSGLIGLKGWSVSTGPKESAWSFLRPVVLHHRPQASVGIRGISPPELGIKPANALHVVWGRARPRRTMARSRIVPSFTVQRDSVCVLLNAGFNRCQCSPNIHQPLATRKKAASQTTWGLSEIADTNITTARLQAKAISRQRVFRVPRQKSMASCWREAMSRVSTLLHFPASFGLPRPEARHSRSWSCRNQQDHVFSGAIRRRCFVPLAEE